VSESDTTSRPASAPQRYTIYRTSTSTWTEAMADSNDRPSAIAWADTFEIDDNAVMSVYDDTTHRPVWSTTGCCAVCGTAITVDLSTICLRAPTGAFSGFACSGTCADDDVATQNGAPGR
jgi:hypothetical protein